MSFGLGSHKGTRSGEPSSHLALVSIPSIIGIRSRHRIVSTNGGASPRWAGDGTELFYLAGDVLMVVAVEAQRDELRLGAPRPLFTHATYGEIYDAMPDGRHFVMIDESLSEAAPTHLVVV